MADTDEFAANFQKLDIAAPEAMREAALECVYHGDKWRSAVQGVCNQLRGRLIPNKMMNRISKIVCTCNAERFNATDDDAFKLHSCKQLQPWFTRNVFEKTEHGLMSVEPILKRMLTGVTLDHASRVRFLVISKQVILGDLSLLQKVNDVNSKKDNRQKYQYDQEIELPLPDKNIKYLVGSQGCHLKPVCKQYNCEIRIERKRWSRFGPRQSRFGPIQPPTTVKVLLKGNDPQSLKEVKQILMDRSADVANKRAKHEIKVTDYANYRIEANKRRQKRREERIAKANLADPKGNPRKGSFWRAADEKKENNRDTFCTKQKHHGADKKSKPPGILEDGSRCVNCLAGYIKGATAMGACRYHSGYVSAKTVGDRYWSCCGEILSASSDQKEKEASHKESGCQTGHHNWRLHKKANRERKNSDKNNFH